MTTSDNKSIVLCEYVSFYFVFWLISLHLFISFLCSTCTRQCEERTPPENQSFFSSTCNLVNDTIPFFFVCLFVFTHCWSTSEIQTVVYCVHFSANFILYCVFSYWFLVYAAVLEKKNKVMPILVILVVIATCLVDQNPKVQTD